MFGCGKQSEEDNRVAAEAYYAFDFEGSTGIKQFATLDELPSFINKQVSGYQWLSAANSSMAQNLVGEFFNSLFHTL